jgi:hypothetical protein
VPTKTEYLADPAVRGFIDYLRALMRGKNFYHGYEIGESRRWECHSLQDALAQYDFNNTGFSKNQKKLQWIEQHLREAYYNNKDEPFYTWCLRTLIWGGGTARNANADWLDCKLKGNEKGNELVRAFRRGVQALGGDKPQFDAFDDNRDTSLRMNSGFSKIYALLRDDFVIYDGRVGAALGLLVTRFLAGNQLSLTSNLAFAWGGEDWKPNSKRDPSSELFIFPRLGKGYRIRKEREYLANMGWNGKYNGRTKQSFHAEMNVRANWILGEVVHDIPFGNGQNPTQKERLRGLEAALFMIGRDVSTVRAESNSG